MGCCASNRLLSPGWFGPNGWSGHNGSHRDFPRAVARLVVDTDRVRHIQTERYRDKWATDHTRYDRRNLFCHGHDPCPGANRHKQRVH